MVSRFINFIRTDIWRIRLSKLSRRRSFLIKQLRIIILALRGFDEDKCLLRASALTFYSLLSIVPVLAIAFGISKGFGLEKTLERMLMAKLQGQEEVVARAIDFAHNLLESAQGSVVAGLGIAFLFWVVIRLLGNIESSFNDIWGIKTPRSLARKFSDYLSIMLVCPILFIVASSITVVIAGQVEAITERIALLGAISPVIFLLLKLLPYCVIWVLLIFIYIFMPNTKVNFKSGLLAGIVAGTIYQVVQWGYIHFQIGAAKYGPIYGSFAALPLFLVWLQVSWLVVLFGAEVSFAHQNVETYEFEPDCLRVSRFFKNLLALRTVQLSVKNFRSGEKPWTATQISHALEIPIRLVRQILYELVESGIISEVKVAENKSAAYQPARDSEVLTIRNVLDALERHGSHDIPVAKSKELDKLSECLKSFGEEVERSPANMALKDI